MYAHQANVDESTRMYTFRKNLNQSLHQKILQISLLLTTIEDMVKAARTLDQNWHMFAGPQRSGQCCNIRAVEGQPTEEINAFQNKSKKQGKLSPEERKCHIDNNLCLYCEKPRHRATEC
jgi:hypothetical protein